MVFEWLESKIPRCSFLKKCMNDNVLMICTNDLTMYYLNFSARSSVSFSAEPPDNNLQKINSRALTTRKDITK